MQGFIINLNKVKEEDLIVSIISKDNLHTLYRFYGARHGTINIGFKIDYEIEESARSTIHRLKDVIHIGFPWINDYSKLRLWQDFLSLFQKHLKDAEDIGNFYFDLFSLSINCYKYLTHFIINRFDRIHGQIEAGFGGFYSQKDRY